MRARIQGSQIVESLISQLDSNKEEEEEEEGVLQTPQTWSRYQRADAHFQSAYSVLKVNRPHLLADLEILLG